MPEEMTGKSRSELLSEIESLQSENVDLRNKIDETERFYEVISLIASEMFWHTDELHRFTYMSPAVVEAVDKPMSDQLGKTRAELSDDDLDSPAWRQHMDDLEAHRPFKNFRYSRRHSSGELREISATGRPVFDENGEFHGYIGVATDITSRLQTEAKAKSAENFLMAAINALDCIFTIWDAEDRLVVSNDHFLRLNAAIPDACKPGVTFEEHLRAIIDNGLTGTGEDPEFWFNSRLDRHRHPRGNFEISRQDGLTILICEAKTEDGSTIILSTDISAQKRTEMALRESQQRLLDFSSTAADWFWEKDAEFRITYVSVEDVDVTGLPADQHIGRTFRETKPLRVSEFDLLALESSLTNRESFSDFRFSRLTEDGNELHLSISGKPIFDENGKFVGYRGGGRNIDNLIKTEEALRREKDRAEQASRAKSEFLAHMSHELRTPLNAILGFSDIIGQQILGPVGSDSYIEYATDIHRSGQHLLSLINDLLDLSKIEAGKFDLEEEDVRLVDVLKQSKRLFQHRLSQRRIRFNSSISEDAARMRADPRALAQIFFNLLSNAEKFNEDGGSIDINVYRGENGGIEVTIKDSGCGFELNEIGTALSPFGRIENPMTKQTPGTGLGLPIVNALMELHDGKLMVSSKIGEGTEVTLQFPSARVI